MANSGPDTDGSQFFIHPEHDALAVARAERKQRRWQERMQRGRQRRAVDYESTARRQPTPSQKAAEECMQRCGFIARSYWGRQLREVIAEAISTAMERPRAPDHWTSVCTAPVHFAQLMAVEWKAYAEERDAGYLFRPVGAERFFAEGLWANRQLWRYDRDVLERLRMRREASVGVWRGE
jgi:hypothetical protein